jgi:hypothetical protein
MSATPVTPHVLVVGAGPAGLFAAETLAERGMRVTVIERMPSIGRKFLMAGRGGLNLTHSEPLEHLLARYPDGGWLAGLIRRFPPEALISWCEGLGQRVFIGSSGRVFPMAMKASPLLRAWAARLDQRGVTILTRTAWAGFDSGGAPVLAGPEGPLTLRPDAVILALGGASWPKLGSDGAWVDELTARGVAVTPLQPSNAGVLISWSEHLIARFAGAPLKRIALGVGRLNLRGEAVITRAGLEGGVVYALNAALRGELAHGGQARLDLDLRPDLTERELAARLSGPRNGASTASILRKRAGLSPEAAALLREAGPPPIEAEPLARRIKSVELTVAGLSGFARAISTAGGVSRAALDDNLMLTAMPGVFCAGEMLDWDAPTGGYLLQASFATGRAAAEGVVSWLESRRV